MGGIPSSGYVEEDRMRSAVSRVALLCLFSGNPSNDIHGSTSNWLTPTLSDSSAVGAGSILVQHLMLIETNNVWAALQLHLAHLQSCLGFPFGMYQMPDLWSLCFFLPLWCPGSHVLLLFFLFWCISSLSSEDWKRDTAHRVPFPFLFLTLRVSFLYGQHKIGCGSLISPRAWWVNFVIENPLKLEWLEG